MTATALGARCEEWAAAYLRTRGLQVLARNYRCRYGEIDLILSDGGCTVFCEVRYRRDARYGGAPASVDARKRRKLIAAARCYLAQCPPERASAPCRFDVLALTGAPQPEAAWIRDAFQADH